MQPEQHNRQDEEQARRPASGQAEAGKPKRTQSAAGDDQRDADAMGEGVIGGAPGKGLDDVGGPGLGVPPGGKNRAGKSGASGSTED